MNVDLPNLTSINSEGFCFYNTRSVTLESISEYWILIVSDIPNLRKVSLPGSFRYTQSQSISSIDCLIDLIPFIDVSSILADHVQIVSDSSNVDSDSDSDSYSDTYSGSE